MKDCKIRWLPIVCILFCWSFLSPFFQYIDLDIQPQDIGRSNGPKPPAGDSRRVYCVSRKGCLQYARSIFLFFSTGLTHRTLVYKVEKLAR